MKLITHLLPCLLLCGCLSTPAQPTGSPGVGLPSHPWKGASAALQTMAARDARLTSVRMSGTLELEESKDRSVLLEAILVLENKPNQTPKLRLQAKKLGHLAFDLTLNETGVWLVDGREKKEGGPEENRGMAQLGKGLQNFVGGRVWAQARPHPWQETEGSFTVQLDDAPNAPQATIHKTALVPLSFLFAGTKDFFHILLEHAPVAAPNGEIFPIPCLIAADSPKGSFRFQASKMEANPALPAAVFTPPKNAVLLKPQ